VLFVFVLPNEERGSAVGSSPALKRGAFLDRAAGSGRYLKSSATATRPIRSAPAWSIPKH